MNCDGIHSRITNTFMVKRLLFVAGWERHLQAELLLLVQWSRGTVVVATEEG